MSISNLFNLEKKNGACGVEIELNYGIRSRDYVLPRVRDWHKEEDGSLGIMGIEYVMDQPRSVNDTHEQIDDLYNAFEKNKEIYIKDLDKAGIHVHINVQDYNCTELFTFACAYLMVEKVLVQWCGEGRVGNHFCLRLSDAEKLLFQMLEATQNKDLYHLNTQDIRYASMNFLSVFKYGSLEFRAMRTPETQKAVHQWVDMLFEIKENAKKFASPLEIIDAMSGQGDKAFLDMLLPSFSDMLFNEGYCKFGDIEEGARAIQMLAYIPDWNKKEIANNNPFKHNRKAWC